MNLASFLNKFGDDRNKVAEKKSREAQEGETTDSSSTCANHTCECDWKPDKQANANETMSDVKKLWRGN